MNEDIAIHWFRQDLRLADNPSLTLAAKSGLLLPVFILDDDNAGEHRYGAASRWWLHHALDALNQSLDGGLRVYCGDAETILCKLVSDYPVKLVSWNRCYEPWRIDRDKRIKATLVAAGIKVMSCNGSLLWEPWQVLKKDHTPYKVFTPFFRKGCLNAVPPRLPLPTPQTLVTVKGGGAERTLAELSLLPEIRWDKNLKTSWNISEQGALARLQKFIDSDLKGYKDARNFPAKTAVTRLSPHIHWGQISPNQIWYDVQQHADGPDVEQLLCELGWREFSYSLLYHFPDLPQANLQSRFNHFPWREDNDALRCWQQGITGYPIVDAGMRELWQTGYMHNRVRMIVGSFLVKNLLIPWQHGAAWFWNCLVDADLANNSASWQWVAGCGADAAPYFRIFNPVTQGEKFDSSGDYIRQFVPELNNLPNKYLCTPWTTPKDILQEAGVELGRNYPWPIVDLKTSRERALQAFQTLKTIPEPTTVNSNR